MLDYEKMLFEIAPWVKEIMQIAKKLNGGSLMRGRTGWVIREIKNPESIYEHSCKLAIATHYLFGTKEAVEQAFIHDFPEIIEPDYLPGEIELGEKNKKEYLSMQKLKEIIPNGDYWFNKWLEYEKNPFLKELDKICPVIQTIDYMKIYKNKNLEEFYPYARKKLSTKPLIELLDNLYLNGVPENESAYQSYFKGLEKIKL